MRRVVVVETRTVRVMKGGMLKVLLVVIDFRGFFPGHFVELFQDRRSDDEGNFNVPDHQIIGFKRIGFRGPAVFRRARGLAWIAGVIGPTDAEFDVVIEQGEGEVGGFHRGFSLEGKIP